MVANTFVSKIMLLIKRNWQLMCIIGFSVVLFSSSFNNFFSGDDWFHLNIVQISSFKEFLNFFNPLLTPQSAAFYRPLSTQLFFFIFYRLFGLWALPYYVFIMLLFVSSLILFYITLIRFKFSKQTALLAVFIFAISHTHFTRLNFLSAGQEVMMSCFFLAGILSNQAKKQNLKIYLTTALFFILALLCKENAIVFPAVIMLLDWLHDAKIYKQKIAILGSITIAYLLMRFTLFNSSMTDIDAYRFNFSPKLALNTFYFYVVWAIGGPELLQDYLSSPITLIDRYFSDFQMTGWLVITTFFLAFISLVTLFLANIKNISLKYTVPACLFVVTLLPVLFLPQHKFTLEMTIPMMCFAVLIAWMCEKKSQWLIACVTVFLLALNGTSIYITNKTHYSVQRSVISQRVYAYFLEHYPTEPANSYFLFRNSNTAGSELITWGSSKQISYALWGSNFIQVFFHDHAIQTEYEDIDFQPPLDEQEIAIDAGKFL